MSSESRSQADAVPEAAAAESTAEVRRRVDARRGDGGRARRRAERPAQGTVGWDGAWPRPPLVRFDAEGRLVAWTPAAARLLGRTATEVQGMTMGEFAEAIGADAEMESQIGWRRGDLGRVIVDAEGQPRIVDWMVVPDGDGSGGVLVIEDVGRLHRAQRDARVWESRYFALVEGVKDGLWDVDLAAGVATLSARCFDLLGIVPGDGALDVDRWIAHIVPQDRKQAETLFRGQRRSDFVDEEWRLVRPNGSPVWVHVRGRACPDERGRRRWVAGSITDVTRQKQWEQEVLRSARADPLTALPNRGYFLEELNRSLARFQRDGERLFAVLFIDLDRFKAVNDGMGHSVGDELLREVALRLRRAVRSGDTVARLGGDEFAVILDPVRDESEAMASADRIGAAVKAPTLIEGKEVKISASIGVALSDPRFTGAEEMLRDADIAMYRAKGDGRSRQLLFDRDMHEDVLRRMEIENDLRAAVVNEELRLVYQPIYDLRTMDLRGMEALLRWRHPKRGNIPPSHFIPIAEDSGAIIEVGRWVFHEACRQMKAWGKAVPKEVYVSVNVSTRQLAEPTLGEEILAAVKKAGQAPRRLGIEITESSMLHGKVAIDAVERLREAGMRMLIDDFGTGYSSLGTVLRLQVDAVKIDRSIVRAAVERGPSVLRALLMLAQGLGADIIAEGIDDREQLILLQSLGAASGQGFLMSPPIEADAVPLTLAHNARKLIDWRAGAPNVGR